MNAVEIEEAVSDLVAKPFDRNEFPFDFLTAFNAKATTIKRLRKGETNATDVSRGILWGKNIHMAVAPSGQVDETFAALRGSVKTASQKVKFILATDGNTVEAEDLLSGDVVACTYADLPRHFATFLPLAGISAVKEIKNNPVDIKATGRLNRLYVQLLKDNPGWEGVDKRPQLNQFMAQLIFCFFAEDTDIFHGSYKFTPTVERMTSGHSDNTQAVIAELFRAMGTSPKERASGNFPTWADGFPYVNGGYLFAGATECPYFSRTARAYLLRAGELDWKEINPDIFGSMIQAVADDGERGELGMHYTSVPNILKVLNPLFLDDLRQQLEAADESKQKLRNLRKRLANIRVFDPACGSGNFLVIAYKEMRAIEAAIVDRLGGEANLKLDDRCSVILLSNFYGIEIKGFAAEIARLALLIAEFQADCLYLSQQEARAMVLPLHKTGQITVDNALRVEWLEVCPPARRGPTAEHDLAGPTGRLALEESGIVQSTAAETYICGNPPYKGRNKQSEDQKSDLIQAMGDTIANVKSLDYVCGWVFKSAQYLTHVAHSSSALVTTNSIYQGEQVAGLWPFLLSMGVEIQFCHLPFKWSNLAAQEAGVTVAVVGLAPSNAGEKRIFEADTYRVVPHIAPYLVAGPDIIVQGTRDPLSIQPPMYLGNMPKDGGNLLFDADQARHLVRDRHVPDRLVRKFWGADEVINASPRHCLWIDEGDRETAIGYAAVRERLEAVAAFRSSSPTPSTRAFAAKPHRFVQLSAVAKDTAIVMPRVSSEKREYLPADMIGGAPVVGDKCYAIYDAPLWSFALLVSRVHIVWIGTVCSRLELRFSYGNTLGWNTFPIPKLTAQNQADLTRCAENILLAREAHYPATIADLYVPLEMPDDLRRAHDENDEVLERIYIGRRFRNDTERLEKLFDLYTKMTADAAPFGSRPRKRAKAEAN